MRDQYRVLLLTSVPGSTEEVRAIAERYFANVEVIFWEMGNAATKAGVVAEIEAVDYNLIISYISGIILKKKHLQRAGYGAINIHPAPPEHGGCWGLWCQPVVRRQVRAHHGVTVHEIDEQIDHGPICAVERWEVPATATIQHVFERSVSDSARMLETVCAHISKSDQGTRSFVPLSEQWTVTNRNTSIAEIRQWFSALDSTHAAHQERVFLNHPRAIIAPPYFDDV